MADTVRHCLIVAISRCIMYMYNPAAPVVLRRTAGSGSTNGMTVVVRTVTPVIPGTMRAEGVPGTDEIDEREDEWRSASLTKEKLTYLRCSSSTNNRSRDKDSRRDRDERRDRHRGRSRFVFRLLCSVMRVSLTGVCVG